MPRLYARIYLHFLGVLFVVGLAASVVFAIGQRSGKPALIWETLVQAARDRIPAIPDGFSTWLGKAHDLTDDWFFKLIEGDLERRFSGE